MGLTLTVSDLWKGYETSVLTGCSFTFDAGNTYAIMGANGTGKSTFLRICALLEEPDSGEINYFSGDTSLNPPLVKGGEYNPMKRDIALRRRLTLVLPKVGVFNSTVYKNVSYGLKIRKIGKEDIDKRVNMALNFVALINKKDHPALTLSSGETQRLGIARAVVIEPDVIFLDEPTASIDVKNSVIVEDIIMKMKEQKGTTIILTTHDISQAKRFTDRILRIHDGIFKQENEKKDFYSIK